MDQPAIKVRVTYDKKSDILYIYEQPRLVSESLANGVVVDLVCDCDDCEGKPIELTGVEVTGAATILRLEDEGYDGETDVLTLGHAVSDPACIIENGAFVGYWEEDPDVPGEYVVSGVALRQASSYLLPLSAAVSSGPPECAFVELFYDTHAKEGFYSKSLSLYVSRHVYWNLIDPNDEGWDFQHVGHC